MQRPLPPQISEGRTLSPADVAEVQSLLIRRDRWIEYYQQKELEVNGAAGGIEQAFRVMESRLRVPLTGYVLQEGPATGFHSDLWAEPSLRLRLVPSEPVVKLELHGFRSEGSEPGHVTLLVNGAEVGIGTAHPGKFAVSATLRARQTEPFDLEIRFRGPVASKGAGKDDRDLAYMLLELRALHPRSTAFRLR